MTLHAEGTLGEPPRPFAAVRTDGVTSGLRCLAEGCEAVAADAEAFAKHRCGRAARPPRTPSNHTES